MKKKGLARFIVLGIAVMCLSLLYFFYPADNNGFYLQCIFHSLTGLDCPGCGSQRAASALLHGHFAKAADYNLLFVLVIPLLIYSAFVFSWNLFCKKKLQQRIFYSPAFVKGVLFIVLAFWIARNIPAGPLTWLKA